MSDFFENFAEASARKGLTPTAAMKKCGVSTGNVTRWKQGLGPNADTLLTLAKTLNVSVDFLLTGEKYSEYDESVARTNTERAILLNLRVLPPEIQATALTYVKGMADAYSAAEKLKKKEAESLIS